MELILLGTGTGIPLYNRASPSLALMVEDCFSVFDLGPGTLRQMARIGLHHERVEHIFLTHFHPDHSADLVHFLFATKYPAILAHRAPFQIIGPVGIRIFLEKIQEAYHPWLNVPFHLLHVDELDDRREDQKSLKHFHIISRPTLHAAQSLAYRIISPEGKQVVYAGDTAFCEDVILLAEDCDLLILECSFPEGQETEGHLTPVQAGQMARLSRAKKLLLLHFYPEVLKTDIAEQCRSHYDGELIIGQDLLHLHL
jgi:ribonuclease BN (tRNA processing enzyme)